MMALYIFFFFLKKKQKGEMNFIKLKYYIYRVSPTKLKKKQKCGCSTTVIKTNKVTL